MAELSFEDVSIIYGDSLFIRKGRLVKVRNVTEENDKISVVLFDLSSRRSLITEFVQEDLKTPAKRIGYVNCDKNAFYVVRQPLRVYKGGISNTNIDIRRPDVGYNEHTEKAIHRIQALDDSGILAAYNNQYPTLERAFELAQEFGSACAFDKQFAVSSTGELFYKSQRVGKYVGGVLDFNSDKVYLKTLLGGNHEKTVRTFGPTPL